MIKASFQKSKIHLFSLGVTLQGGRDYITHPYHKGKCYYPVFAIIVMVAFWSFTLSVYRPPKVLFNRQQRRANHMK